MRSIYPALLFLLAAPSLSFGFDPDNLLSLYAPGADLPGVAAVSEPAPAAEPEDYVRRLREAAAADPEAFIDDRTPYEVGLAFDMFPSRYRVDAAFVKKAWLLLTVDLSSQRLTALTAETRAEYKISSGLAPEHGTPGSGRCYAPDFMEEMHYSNLYNKAPMPNSVFFNGNIAMHGTNAEALLGRPASHGCVRLSKRDARTVYELVKANGKAHTAICVTGATPVN